MITCKSYFSGGGGMDLGLSLSGIQVIQSLEIDSTCCNTLRNNFKHEVVETDIKSILVNSQPKTDIIVGTYPCTKYSAIGDIKGIRNGDELFLHFFRHIALEEPEMYIVENVPGMRKFKVVMEALTELPHYYVNVFCPVNALNWLPQSRPRLILIGSKRPFKIEMPEKTTRPLFWELLENWDGEPNPDYVKARYNNEYRDGAILLDPTDLSTYARTLMANYGKDKRQLVKDTSTPDGYRPLSVREYQRLMGFPDSFVFFGSKTDQYKQIGNAVVVPLAQWLGKEAIKYFKK